MSTMVTETVTCDRCNLTIGPPMTNHEAKADDITVQVNQTWTGARNAMFGVKGTDDLVGDYRKQSCALLIDLCESCMEKVVYHLHQIFDPPVAHQDRAQDS